VGWVFATNQNASAIAGNQRKKRKEKKKEERKKERKKKEERGKNKKGFTNKNILLTLTS